MMTKDEIDADARWKQYYLRFSDEHGGNPLQWRGWSLFSDGWRYSCTRYSGPELPPRDEAEAKALSLIYWNLRKQAVEIEIFEIRQRLADERVRDDDREQLEDRLSELEEDSQQSQRILADELDDRPIDEQDPDTPVEADEVAVPNL